MHHCSRRQPGRFRGSGSGARPTSGPAFARRRSFTARDGRAAQRALRPSAKPGLSAGHGGERRMMLGRAVGRAAGQWLLVGAALMPLRLAAQTPLTIGRLHYDGGGDWYANPSSLPNLLQAIATRTSIPVTAREKTVT